MISKKEIQEGKKRSSETENHEKQHLTTLIRLKRGDDNELERNLRLEEVVASKQLRLVVETEERRARPDNDADTKLLRLAMEADKERKGKTGEDGSYQTAKVGHGDGRRKKTRLEKMVVGPY